MKQAIKSSLFLSALLIITLTYIFSLNSYAQDEGKQQGWKKYLCKKTQKKPSCKAELLAELKKVQKDEDAYVEGYIIDGSDIIAVIEETNRWEELTITRITLENLRRNNFFAVFILSSNRIIEHISNIIYMINFMEENYKVSIDDIKIRNSVIEGGLDFRKLNGKREVNNAIELKDSEIGFWPEMGFAGPQVKYSVNADEIKFNKNTSFNRSTFSGKAFFTGADFGSVADFLKATFCGEVSFRANFGGVAEFAEVTFFELADFSDATFSDAAEFVGANFGGIASFPGGAFSGQANFSEATFGGVAEFSGRNFGHETYFSGATFNSEANFSEATFGYRASFSGATFGDVVNFSGATFSGEALFTGANFGGAAFFLETTFKNSAILSGAAFNKLLFFIKARFYGEFELNNILFKEYVDFRDARIRKLNCKNYKSTIVGVPLDLRGAQITEAHFENIVLKEDVDFSDVEFGTGLFIDDDILDLPAFIYELKIQSSLETDNPGKRIWEYLFGYEACSNKMDNILCGTVYSLRVEEVSKIWSIINESSPLSNIADLNGCIEFSKGLKPLLTNHLNLILKDRNFYNINYFKSVNPGGEAKKLISKGIDNFSDEDEIIKLNRHLLKSAFPGHIANPATVFRFVSFESDVSFIRTKFYGDMAFENVKFKGEANFTNAEFKHSWDDREPRLSLSYFYFKNLILRFDQLPELASWVSDSSDRIKSFVDKKDEKGKRLKLKDLQPLSQVLEGLEETFRDENRLSDKNQAYYYRKKLEPKNSTWLRVESLIWGKTTDYGTNLSPLVIPYGIAFVLLTLILFLRGRVIELQTGEHKIELRLLVTPTRYFAPSNICFGKKPKNLKGVLINFWHTIKLSFELLFKVKIGNKDTAVAGNNWDKAIVALGWIIGFLLLVAFTTTLANTSPFISKLISGVF